MMLEIFHSARRWCFCCL